MLNEPPNTRNRITDGDIELMEKQKSKQIQLGLASPLSIRSAQTQFQKALRATIEASRLKKKVERLSGLIDKAKGRDTTEEEVLKEKDPLDLNGIEVALKEVSTATPINSETPKSIDNEKKKLM